MPQISPTLSSLGLLLGRVVLGVIFLAHGYQKLFIWTPAGTAQGFEGMGIPLAGIAGPFIGVLELVGGALLILGLGTRVVGLLLALDMLVAALVVHLPMGIWAENGGWELVGALGAGAIMLAGVGAGQWSLDHLIAARRGPRASQQTADETARGSRASA